MNTRWTAYVISLLALVVPATAHANIGIPMLALAWPVYWIAFIPVVVIESEYACNRIGLSRRDGYKAVAYANAASTLVGIPLAWGVMLLTTLAVDFSLSFVPDTGIRQGLHYALFPLASAWLGPTENAWTIYAAFVCLALPMWYGSVLIEAQVVRRMLAPRHAAMVRGVVIRFNILTYVLIVLVVGVYATWLAAGAI